MKKVKMVLLRNITLNAILKEKPFQTYFPSSPTRGLILLGHLSWLRKFQLVVRHWHFSALRLAFSIHNQSPFHLVFMLCMVWRPNDNTVSWVWQLGIEFRTRSVFLTNRVWPQEVRVTLTWIKLIGLCFRCSWAKEQHCHKILRCVL